MNIKRTVLREYYLWVGYPKARLRWLFRGRHSPIVRKKFKFGGVEFPYFVHPYNSTWTNERAVEIPVVLHFLGASVPSPMLEVGNVMSHYFDLDHEVVDLFEKCRYRPVINCDLLEFNTSLRFKRIISISTIEHIGWDEKPRAEEKVVNAFTKLRSLLTSDGKVIVSFPVGYNHSLDQLVRESSIDNVRYQCLKRISADNQWVETDLQEALNCKYGYPFMNGNAIVFIYLSGDSRSHSDQMDSSNTLQPA